MYRKVASSRLFQLVTLVYCMQLYGILKGGKNNCYLIGNISSSLYSRAEAHSTNVRQGDMAEFIQNNRYLPMKSTSTQSSTLSSTTLSTLPHTLGLFL